MSCAYSEKSKCFWFTRSFLLMLSFVLIPLFFLFLPFYTTFYMGLNCFYSCAKPICKGNIPIAILCTLLCAIPILSLVIGLATTFGVVIGVTVCSTLTLPVIILYWYHFFCIVSWHGKTVVWVTKKCLIYWLWFYYVIRFKLNSIKFSISINIFK